MINVSGRGKIVIPPMEEKGEIDIQIEYARRKTLVLTATSYLMKQAMAPLKTGDMIRFKGLLDETEPGYYIVKLSELEKTVKS